MGLTAGHVGELVAELRPLVRGRLVEDVQAHPPRDLLLVLAPGAGPGDASAARRIRRLRISADPEAARLHLQIDRVHRHTGTTGPFFRLCVERLAGATLAELVQVAGDRIVRLEFRREGRPSGALLGELTGRHANLVLLDRAGRVEATLVSPRAGSAAARRLAAGAEYALPPGTRKAGPGVPLAEAFDAPAPDTEAAERLAERAPLSWRVEAGLGRAAEDRFAEEERKDLARRLERRVRSARNQVAGLERRAQACAGAEEIGRDAEHLLAHLGRLRRGQTEVVLPDMYDTEAPPRRIALDAKLDPRANVERLFAKKKKLERTAARLPEELALARAQVDALEELAERARTEGADARALEAEALAGGWLPKRQAPPERRRPEPRLPYHAFRGARGSEIRVGRSARDNDRLTFKAARGNDLWLHTKDAPGSHVVLLLERGREPDPEELVDAAHLAVHFSPLRGAQRADVHVARCKEVRKPRRAPAGLVTLSGGRTQSIRMEPERLARLLDTRRPGAGPSSG